MKRYSYPTKCNLSVKPYQNNLFISVQALYENSHPEYLKYIYLIAPISVVFLNPIGFTLLELQERKNLADKHSKDSLLETEGRAIERHPGGDKGLFRKSNCLTLTLHVAKGVLTNPIVFMTVIGIVGNFIFGHKIPAVIDGILKVLGKVKLYYTRYF